MTITGSALPRLLNCPSSAVLPRAETASPWAESGQVEHEELAHQTLTGTHPPKRAALVPPSPRVEVKLAYDVVGRTGRFLGSAADRNYGSPGPFEIVMSADVVGVDGDCVVVLDWKTGFADVEPAATNGQLWGGALAACRALGKSKAIIRIVYTNRGDRCDEYEIDALELAEFAGRLERLHVNVAGLKAAHQRGETLPTREGLWCKHCASKHVCPSKVALIGQLGGLTVIGAAVTRETAAAAYEQVVRVEQLVKEARQRLSTFVDEQGPIDLGNGRMFGRYVRGGNESLSGDIAVVAIAEVVGESAREFELLAVERKTSKAAIERAAKQLGCRRGTTPAVIRRIRELGGASHGNDTMPIGEYVRDRDEPAERPALDVGAINAALEST
jgi:hypothetical protein